MAAFLAVQASAVALPLPQQHSSAAPAVPSRRAFLHKVLRTAAMGTPLARMAYDIYSMDEQDLAATLTLVSLGTVCGTAAKNIAPEPAAAVAAVAPEQPAVPTIFEVCTADELRAVLAAAADRLVVLHAAAPGCPLDAAYQPHLQQVAERQPGALFVRFSGEAAELQSILPLATAPCTLLLRGGCQLARVEVAGSAVAAATQLEAVLAAMLAAAAKPAVFAVC